MQADERAPRVLTLARRRCAGGERALLIAAKAGREDLVELLADFKAEFDQSYAQGMTALHWASQEGKIDMVQILVKVGANVEAKDKDGYNGGTSLHFASWRGHAAVVQTLLQHGANVAATDKYGRTALDLAGRDCDDEVKKEEVKAALREHGAEHSLM